MNLVERVKNILLQPKEEWLKIAGETTDVKSLYIDYILILAAIPAIAGFIGNSLIGKSIPFLGTYRTPFLAGIAQMVVTYVMSLVMVYILALIIDALAPTFKGEKNMIQALKVAAYSSTASWIAGIFAAIPYLGILAILGLYGIYLLYTGLPRLMKSPEDKAIGYTVVVIICAIVLSVIVGIVAGLFMVTPSIGDMHNFVRPQ
jgi:hypothetical protein